MRRVLNHAQHSTGRQAHLRRFGGFLSTLRLALRLIHWDLLRGLETAYGEGSHGVLAVGQLRRTKGAFDTCCTPSPWGQNFRRSPSARTGFVASRELFTGDRPKPSRPCPRVRARVSSFRLALGPIGVTRTSEPEARRASAGSRPPRSAPCRASSSAAGLSPIL
jgi:hypothetical protein